jgi:hypothetical protein
MHRGVNSLTDSVKNHPVPAIVVARGSDTSPRAD